MSKFPNNLQKNTKYQSTTRRASWTELRPRETAEPQPMRRADTRCVKGNGPGSSLSSLEASRRHSSGRILELGTKLNPFGKPNGHFKNGHCSRTWPHVWSRVVSTLHLAREGTEAGRGLQAIKKKVTNHMAILNYSRCAKIRPKKHSPHPPRGVALEYRRQMA